MRSAGGQRAGVGDRVATGRSDNIPALGVDHIFLRETDEMDAQQAAMYRIERR